MWVVFLLIGLVLGVGIGALLFRHPYAGALQIIDDDDGTYLSAALERDMVYLRKRKYVNMRIRELHNDYYEETQ